MGDGPYDAGTFRSSVNCLSVTFRYSRQFESWRTTLKSADNWSCSGVRTDLKYERLRSNRPLGADETIRTVLPVLTRVVEPFHWWTPSNDGSRDWPRDMPPPLPPP